jgi:hypothetical protein
MTVPQVQYGTTADFLDVHSAAPISSHGDMDASSHSYRFSFTPQAVNWEWFSNQGHAYGTGEPGRQIAAFTEGCAVSNCGSKGV